MSPESIHCPLCGEGGTRHVDAETGALGIGCNKCAPFFVTEDDLARFLSDPGDSEKYTRISALLRENRIAKGPTYFLRFTGEPCASPAEATPIHVEELLSRWPRSYTEKIDRVLGNYVRSGTPGAAVRVDYGSDQPFFFAAQGGESTFIHRVMEEEGLIQTDQYGDRVTHRGMVRFDDAQLRRREPTSRVFVAMWFGRETDHSRGKMTDAYMNGIKPGIENAGYVAARADMEEHSDDIMFRVIGQIRIANFVVADYTGHRNGVYYEAGFARGLGLEVIPCCRQDAMKDAHFDTRQLNHVLWKTPDDLREGLSARILGQIGAGPFFKADEQKAPPTGEA